MLVDQQEVEVEVEEEQVVQLDVGEFCPRLGLNQVVLTKLGFSHRRCCL